MPNIGQNYALRILTRGSHTRALQVGGENEHQICYMKERSRCTSSTFLFSYVSTQIVIHLVYNICLWFNMFPLKLGISIQDIVTQRKVDYIKDCKAGFGAYIEASTDAIVNR